MLSAQLHDSTTTSTSQPLQRRPSSRTPWPLLPRSFKPRLLFPSTSAPPLGNISCSWNRYSRYSCYNRYSRWPNKQFLPSLQRALRRQALSFNPGILLSLSALPSRPSRVFFPLASRPLPPRSPLTSRHLSPTFAASAANLVLDQPLSARPFFSSRGSSGGGDKADVASSTLADAARKAAGGDAAAAAESLNVENVQKLFQQLSTSEVANAILNLEMAAREMVVDASSALLTSPVMRIPLVAGPVLWGVRKTAHKHFCAGETLERRLRRSTACSNSCLKGILDFSISRSASTLDACAPTLATFAVAVAVTATTTALVVARDGARNCAEIRLSRRLHGIPAGPRDGGGPRRERRSRRHKPCRKRRTRVEDALDDETCDRNMEGFLRTIRMASQLSPPMSPTYFTPTSAPSPLTPSEEAAITSAHNRLRKICDACADGRLPLLIDAEYQSVEPAIDYLAYALMMEYNKMGVTVTGGGKEGSKTEAELPLVYSTVQCYLRDAKPRLAASFGAAQEAGVGFGVKLVRGAYLCYDACAGMMIDAAGAAAKRESKGESGPAAGVVLATHNYGSGRVAVMRAGGVGLARTDPRLHFAQLKGMQMGSLGIGFAGFNASKYLPYGP
ncbi:unnamed protein product, partial [Closterium sp. NIES-64]